MSWVTLSNKKVKTKKDHVRFGCHTKFLMGIEMNKNVSVDGGDFSSTYWCGCCEEFMKDKWRELDGDGIGEGEIWQYNNYRLFHEKYYQVTEIQALK